MMFDKAVYYKAATILQAGRKVNFGGAADTYTCVLSWKQEPPEESTAMLECLLHILQALCKTSPVKIYASDETYFVVVLGAWELQFSSTGDSASAAEDSLGRFALVRREGR